VSPDELSVGLRTLAFVALFQAAGATLFLAAFRRELMLTAEWLRRLGLYAALAGALLTLLHQSLEAARMMDDFSGLLDREMLQLAWFSGNGVAHGVQTLGLTCIALALCRRRRPLLPAAIVGALLATLAPLLTGHTSIHALRWALAPLLAVHLLIVACWFGALAPLYRVVQRERTASAARIVTRFSALASWSVPLILVAGLGMALMLAPDMGVLHRPYGQLLLAKFGGFSLLMLLAAYNKWRLTPALAAGNLRAATGLRRVIALEYVLIVAVLALTANLTSFYSPES
jgi:putative copper export protein